MTTHQWFIEHLTAFVIRSLDADEERAFHAHLQGCEECRAAVERLQQELAWLPMGVEAVTPRPGLTRQLAETALGARPRRPIGALLAVAAALVLALGAIGWAAARVRTIERTAGAERQELARQLDMVRDTLEIMRGADRVRHASIRMGNQEGGMVIFADDRTHRWNVVVYGLPASLPGEVCQFWFITDTGMVRGVEVKNDGRWPAFMTLPMPPAGGTVMGAALTMEPAGSASAAPLGKELAHLLM